MSGAKAPSAARVDDRAGRIVRRFSHLQQLLPRHLGNDLAGDRIDRLVDVGSGGLVFLDDQTQIGLRIELRGGGLAISGRSRSRRRRGLRGRDVWRDSRNGCCVAHLSLPPAGWTGVSRMAEGGESLAWPSPLRGGWTG